MESEMEQRQYDECKSCLKNIDTIDRLTAQLEQANKELAKYQGGVEVEGIFKLAYYDGQGDFVFDSLSMMPANLMDKRVRVLIMKEVE